MSYRFLTIGLVIFLPVLLYDGPSIILKNSMEFLLLWNHHKSLVNQKIQLL